MYRIVRWNLRIIIQKELNHCLYLKVVYFKLPFALIYLQKHYYFTHNDLHINSVMYQSTDRPFLYYKYNNQFQDPYVWKAIQKSLISDEVILIPFAKRLI